MPASPAGPPESPPAAAHPDPAGDGRCCDLCGSRAFQLLHAWPAGDFWNSATIPIAVWQCGCGLVFLHPVPTPEQLPDSGDWWSGKRKFHRRRWWFKRRWKKLRSSIYGTLKERLVRYTRKVMPTGRLLDVGCGEGELMSCAASHYSCVGLEPSAVAAATARSHGFPIIESTLEAAVIDPESFDVVLMDSVIEHVVSPMAALTKVNRILKPGGVVAMLTPKFGGAGVSHAPGGMEWLSPRLPHLPVHRRHARSVSATDRL